MQGTDADYDDVDDDLPDQGVTCGSPPQIGEGATIPGATTTSPPSPAMLPSPQGTGDLRQADGQPYCIPRVEHSPTGMGEPLDPTWVGRGPIHNYTTATSRPNTGPTEVH